MVILLLFNKKESWTFEEIKDKTQIPEADLKRHLISLAAPKYRVLLKNPPKGKAIHPDHAFSFNAGYEAKYSRVRIPLVSVRAQQAKQNKEPEEVPKQV